MKLKKQEQIKIKEILDKVHFNIDYAWHCRFLAASNDDEEKRKAIDAESCNWLNKAIDEIKRLEAIVDNARVKDDERRDKNQ